ncbi:MAG: succinyldiaminopimelate transaminase [Gammaproteobacteria bacterium]|nr:succinyldiaminopimelate transaminase [Gammaproteobacteria bacterium]
MNQGLKELQPYPFERLAEIRARVNPPDDRKLINLSLGEPQHQTPAFIHEALIDALSGTARYPATRGLPELREAIGVWARRRFHLPDGALTGERHVLPVNGTREALFAIAQCVVDRSGRKNTVLVPNPFYQIYEGAALLAGARPHYLPCPAARGFRPDWNAVTPAVWERTALVYVCSPGNPSGAVLDEADYELLTAAADRWDFVIVADECYSELYLDEDDPPLGLLEFCARHARDTFERCLVMHSLSKRSNAPGLRSGFVAGDANLIEAFYRYRTYHGSAMPIPVQHASIAAWSDEDHVTENRVLYRRKFECVLPILAEVSRVERPRAGFYLWPELEIDDLTACEQLLRDVGVLTLPGSFLGRATATGNPGANRLRIALVADLQDCEEAALRIRESLRNR